MLSELEVIKQHQNNISNGFASLKNLNHCVDINKDWENIKENIKTSAKDTLGHEREESVVKQHN